MKVLIEISEENIEKIRHANQGIFINLYDIMATAINNGTPLPKGYGRLIDADALYENADICHSDEGGSACVEWRDINHAPTIIEADNAENEENEQWIGGK